MTLNSTKKKKEKQFLHQYYWRTVPCPCLLAHQYRLETHATSSISSSSIISFKFFCRKFFAKYWRNCSFSLWTNKCLWLVFILHRLFTARHFPSTLFLLGNDVRIRLIVFFSLFFFISIQIYYNAKLTKAALSLLDQVKHYAAAHFLQRSVAVLL